MRIFNTLTVVLMLSGAVSCGIVDGPQAEDDRIPDAGSPGDGGTESGDPEQDTLTTAYFEYPQTLVQNPDYRYGTLRGKTYRTGKDVRNYSYCYDVKRHNPMWVAYPCHTIYWEGGYTRPYPDPWRPNPDLSEQEQSVIYASDWDGWPWASSDRKPSDRYHYWTNVTHGKNIMLSKGHMMRSAERGAGRSDVLFGMNEQSFYPTNINPERHAYVKVPDYVNSNGGQQYFDLSHWSMVEYALSSRWRCSDTLYVVVGCWYDRDQNKAVDASYWGARSSRSKEVTVPAGRYKAVLRTIEGNTGKSISGCEASELTAIVFWFDQCFDADNEKVTLPPLSECVMSVADLEKKIGGEFNLFPDVPEEVKESYDVSHWPGLADIINDPLDSSFDLSQIKGY